MVSGALPDSRGRSPPRSQSQTTSHSQPGSIRERSHSRQDAAQQEQAGSPSSKTASVRSHASANKLPHYEEAALSIDASPQLTSYLNDRHSASSIQEEKYLQRAFHLRIARLVLSGLLIAISAAAVGCSGHVLQRYNATHLPQDFHLNLWPENIDLRATLGVLIPAALVMFSSLVYLLVALIPSPHSRTSLHTHLFTATTTITFLLSLFSLLFTTILTYPPHPSTTTRETIHSFTCRLVRSAASFNHDIAALDIPTFSSDTNAGISAPTGFKRICNETEASTGLVGGMLVLGLLALVVVGWGLWVSKGIEKGRKQRFGEKWRMNGRQGSGEVGERVGARLSV